jgi:cytochrome c oxidase subunit 2
MMGRLQSALDPAGPQAGDIAALTWWFFGVCAFVYVAVIAALVWAIFRRRAPSDDSPETSARLAQVIGAAVVLSTVILIVLTVSTVATGRGMTSASGSEAVVVNVIGHQWWWDFHYTSANPSEHVSAPNELHIPVGVPVAIRAVSRDVIHSFWVPQLHGKRDLIPGFETSMWIQADRAGIYRGQCAEFCGHQHAHMAFLVIAEPMNAFQSWLAQQRRSAPPPTTAEQQRGHDVFIGGPCVMCHTIRGTAAGSRIGPDLTHVAGRRTIASGTLPTTREHLARWIVDAQSIKPGNRMPPNPMSDADLQALLAYIETLR